MPMPRAGGVKPPLLVAQMSEQSLRSVGPGFFSIRLGGESSLGLWRYCIRTIGYWHRGAAAPRVRSC